MPPKRQYTLESASAQREQGAHETQLHNAHHQQQAATQHHHNPSHAGPAQQQHAHQALPHNPYLTGPPHNTPGPSFELPPLLPIRQFKITPYGRCCHPGCPDATRDHIIAPTHREKKDARQRALFELAWLDHPNFRNYCPWCGDEILDGHKREMALDHVVLTCVGLCRAARGQGPLAPALVGSSVGRR